MEMEFGNYVVEKTLRGSQFRFQRPRTPDLLGRPNAGLLAGLGFAPARPQGIAEPTKEEQEERERERESYNEAAIIPHNLV